MSNATSGVRRAPTRPRLEQLQTRAMLDDLRRILIRTGRMNVTAITEACHANGYTIARETIERWFCGTNTPYRTCDVERVAIAAGVDLAYLMPDAPDLDIVDEWEPDRFDDEPPPPTHSQLDRLAGDDVEHTTWPSFDAFELVGGAR